MQSYSLLIYEQFTTTPSKYISISFVNKSFSMQCTPFSLNNVASQRVK